MDMYIYICGSQTQYSTAHIFCSIRAIGQSRDYLSTIHVPSLAQIGHQNPLFLACKNGKNCFYFDIYSVLAGCFRFWCFEMNFASFFFFFCLPCGLARPLIYMYIYTVPFSLFKNSYLGIRWAKWLHTLPVRAE